MEVLIIGGGGREHALAWKIAASPLVDRISVTHSNPGFPAKAELVQGDVVDFAERAGVDLVVIGPEAPLAAGLSDLLEERGIAVFGPSRAAARLEWSKSFAKEFMARHRIPTAAGNTYDSAAAAHRAVTGPCVVKADGLAAGKGVIVARDEYEAHAAIDQIMGGTFGTAGDRVILEERLEGPEVSVMAFCDGERAIPMLPCRDYKRRLDRDRGPNTGGMGAVCPAPGVSMDLVHDLTRTVLNPTVQGMAREGVPFRGVLYAGLMLTRNGPRVLEFNTRFGDPECQPLMMMLDQDIVPLMLAAARGRLPDGPLRWKDGAACCVVMVADAYPGTVPTGMPIQGLPVDDNLVQVFFGAAKRGPAGVVTDGGRVLGVTAFAPRLPAARVRAYRAARSISFESAAFREDIGEDAGA